MSIAGIQPGSGTHGVDFEAATDQRRTSAAAQGNDTDTVTISDEARARALEMRSSGEQGYPLEAYRIPDWYVDLTGGYTAVTARIGASWEEARTGYERLGNSDKAKYDEYVGILGDHYRQARADAGVPVTGDVGDYYHNFLQNEATQEAVHQGLLDRLAADPRAMELMRRFGIEM